MRPDARSAQQGGAQTLLGRLKCVKRRGPDGWQALCPAHADRNPSLSIQEQSDGVVLIHCHAGCATPDVVAAVGLDMWALYPPKERKRRPATHDDGDLVAIPREVLTDTRFLALSPAAHKLLNVAILRNLTATNNGNMMVLAKKPQAYGFSNWRTLSRARDELLRSGFLEISRPGGHGRATLYGVTWRALHVAPGMCPVSTPGPSKLWTTKPMPATRDMVPKQPTRHDAKTAHQTARHGAKIAHQTPLQMVPKEPTDMYTLTNDSIECDAQASGIRDHRPHRSRASVRGAMLGQSATGSSQRSTRPRLWRSIFDERTADQLEASGCRWRRAQRDAVRYGESPRKSGRREALGPDPAGTQAGTVRSTDAGLQR